MNNASDGRNEHAADDAAAECHRVLVDFLAAIDRGRATEALELFTPDASFAARGKQLHGRDEIASFLAAREADRERHTAHLIANAVVRRATRGELELTALVFLHERRPDGRYEIERVLDTVQVFRRTDTGWRICRRTTSPLHPSGSGGEAGVIRGS